MAARWETVIGSGVKAWAPHRCEDYVIIDALLRVRDQEAYDRDMTLLFNRYLGQGEALSDADLELLNERLADAGLDPVELIETRPDSYAQQKGYGKANVRNAIMRTIAGMTVSKRTETIMQYRQEALSGPKPMYNGNGTAVPAAAMAPATPPASSEPPIAAPRAADGGQPAATPAPAEPARTVPEPDAGGLRQFELTFSQVMKRTGRVTVTATDLGSALAMAQEVGLDQVTWNEAVAPTDPRVTGVLEV